MARKLTDDKLEFRTLTEADHKRIERALKQMALPKVPPKPPKRHCKIVYMRKGKPVECGGVVKKKEVHKPFDMYTPISGPRERIMTFKYCAKCGAMRVDA